MAGNASDTRRAVAAGEPLAELERKWERLFRQSTASPFLTPQWVAQWLEVHSQALRPTLFEYDVQGSPVAMALLVPSIRRRGPVAFRQLHLNTDGEPASESVVVENNSLLCLDEALPASLERLALAVRAADVHEFVIAGLIESQLSAFIAAFPGWSADIECRFSSLVDLEAVRRQGGDLLPLLSANKRSQLRRAIRKYEAVAPLTIEAASSVVDAEIFLRDLIGLHEARWQAVGHSGAFASPARLAFHKGFVRRALPAGAASLVRVRCGDETIGVIYCLTAKGKVNFYQSGFRRTDDPHLKPGLVSHLLAIRHFAESGHDEYDFLASARGESNYKQSLETGQRPLYWLTLARPSIRNAVLRISRRFRRSLSSPT